ncbi:MAG: transposase [Chthoniobacteraceae bacterium]
MARQIRIEYEGAFYHVMARGDRREDIFEDDGDREIFLKTLGEACAKTGWRVHAWVLMGNHYHWVLETPHGNLVEGMRWFQNTYTRRFNRRHLLWGHVFGGRYKAVVVQTETGSKGGDYLATLIDYVHWNPVRGGMVKLNRGKGLLDYRWSSLSQGYAVAPGKRAPWMETATGFALAGRRDDTSGRRRMVEDLERRVGGEGMGAAGQGGCLEGEARNLQSTLQRGWYWGNEAFKEMLLGRMKAIPRRENRNYRHSEQGRDVRMKEAKEWLEEGRRAMGLKQAELEKTERGDLRRVAIAWAIARKTTVSQGWVAERLGLRTAANVSQRVRRFEMLSGKELPPEIQAWVSYVKIC